MCNKCKKRPSRPGKKECEPCAEVNRRCKAEWRRLNREKWLASSNRARRERIERGICLKAGCGRATEDERFCVDHRTGKRFAGVLSRQAPVILRTLKEQFGARWPEAKPWCEANVALWVDLPEWFLHNYIPLDDVLRREAGINETEVEGICQ